MTSSAHLPPDQSPGAAGGATPATWTPSTTQRPKSALRFTRIAAFWWALTASVIFLLILLIFIAQNTNAVAMHFLGLDWSLPIGVAFLLSAVCGAAIAVLAGAARIIQLRRAAKKNLMEAGELAVYGNHPPPPVT
jgi:uncharacterized integral membrane protein